MPMIGVRKSLDPGQTKAGDALSGLGFTVVIQAEEYHF